jgi:hypothetical protein
MSIWRLLSGDVEERPLGAVEAAVAAELDGDARRVREELVVFRFAMLAAGDPGGTSRSPHRIWSLPRRMQTVEM